MNIKEAKNEVMKAVKIYLEKDEHGEYRVPVVRQRPLFLQGAPGLGKTAIMEQVASELDIALVSYSMTHHTRQSAIGLPFLKEVTYGGKTYTKSEYTMSEIIASVYDVIEKTGKKEGILFLDEINCVSETLAPAMLLFLQYKRFGNLSVPEGWVVVTAGNPPQYNKSVKDFDVATQDRLKMVEIEPELKCWKEYAYNAGIHPAITAFLETNNKYFYDIKSTVNGKEYITARGWEDLSTEIQAYERNNFPVNEDLIMQYITNKECARKFAVYYDLFKKYRVDYAITDILAGSISEGAVNKAAKAQFDERLSIISMIMEAIGTSAKVVTTDDAAMREVVTNLRRLKKAVGSSDAIYQMLQSRIDVVKDKMEIEKLAYALSGQKIAVYYSEIRMYEKYKKEIDEKGVFGGSNSEQFAVVKAAFQADVKSHTTRQNKTDKQMDNAFTFISKAWGDDNQEMTLFVAELTVNRNIAEFIATNKNKSYFQHNSSMLVYDQDKNLKEEIQDVLASA